MVIARFLIRLIAATLIVFLFFILTQTIQIFPSARLFGSPPADSAWQTFGAESHFVTTADGERIELWRLAAVEPAISGRAAVIFHGNGGDLRNFYPYQEWFAERGIVSYGLDYRGYGRSTGWPSEQGLYLDGEAVVDYIIAREKIAPAQVVPVGISIGSGPAAYAARRYRTESAMFFAPYHSLTALVGEMPVFGYLTPFLQFEFPVAKMLAASGARCVVFVHGAGDGIIPPGHSRRLRDELSELMTVELVEIGNAGHNDLLREPDALRDGLLRCVR